VHVVSSATSWSPCPGASPWAGQGTVPQPAHPECSFLPLPACSHGRVPAPLLLRLCKGSPGQPPLPAAPGAPPCPGWAAPLPGCCRQPALVRARAGCCPLEHRVGGSWWQRAGWSVAGGSCALAPGCGRAVGACSLLPLGARPARTARSQGVSEQAPLSSSSVLLWHGLG